MKVTLEGAPQYLPSLGIFLDFFGRAGVKGRATPENVTSVSSWRAMAGPMPLTRSSPLREPNGPSFSRSATIVAASLGPMRGSRSSSADEARSRSRGPVGALLRCVVEVTRGGRGAVFVSAARAGRRLPERVSRLTESTREICR